MDDYIEKGVYLLGIIGTSFFIASTIVSYFVYEPTTDPENVKYESEEETELEPIFKEPEYEEKYKKELDEISECRNLTEDDLVQLKNKVLDEETPLGLVKMYYCNEYKGFVWYCDRNHVPYRFLDTVVRKYILDFDCHQLYIDLKKEIESSNKLVDKAVIKLGERKNVDGIFKKNKSRDKIILKKLAIKNKYLKFKYGGRIEEYKKEEPSSYNLINIDFSTFKSLKSQEKTD